MDFSEKILFSYYHKVLKFNNSSQHESNDLNEK